GLSKWEIAQFVHDDEVESGDEVGQPPLLSAACLRFEPIDEVVPVANRLIEEGGYDVIVASQDWHPADHGSFASQHPGRQLSAPRPFNENRRSPRGHYVRNQPACH